MSLPVEYRASLGRDGYSIVNKFGFQAAVGTTVVAVWDQAAAYNYIAAATVLKVSSADANDTAAGTGAQTVTIYGLDGNYAEVNETVTLSGTTDVSTTQTFLRVFRIVVNTAGSGGVNAGIIYVYTGADTAGVPDDLTKVYAQVTASENQTLMAVYTVPANKKALFRSLFIAGEASQIVTIRVVARPLGGAFNTKDKFLIEAGNTAIQHPYPVAFDEKVDIEVRGHVSASTTAIAAAFDIILIPKVGGE